MDELLHPPTWNTLLPLGIAIAFLLSGFAMRRRYRDFDAEPCRVRIVDVEWSHQEGPDGFRVLEIVDGPLAGHRHRSEIATNPWRRRIGETVDGWVDRSTGELRTASEERYADITPKVFFFAGLATLCVAFADHAGWMETSP